MPTKTPQDHKAKSEPPTLDPDDDRFDVVGRRFVWHGLDDDDERTIDVTIPLRLKLGLLRAVPGGLDESLDPETMFAIVEKLAPEQADQLDELDINDFVAMFTVWRGAYEAQNGATLGEASRSPS